MRPNARLVGLLVVCGGAAVIVLLVGVLALRAPEAAGRSVIADVELDGFRYVVAEDDMGSPLVTVFYPENSLTGLKEYAAQSRAQGEILLSAGVEPLYVEVTFDSPLSAGELAELVAQTEMQVAEYNMRAIDARGDRVGMQGSPRGDELVPAWPLEQMLRGVAENSGGEAQFKGFISVQGMVDRRGYEKLLSHQKVFLVDVTVNLAYQVLKERGRTVSPLDIQLLMVPPYWYMENLGLENFQ